MDEHSGDSPPDKEEKPIHYPDDPDEGPGAEVVVPPPPELSGGGGSSTPPSPEGDLWDDEDDGMLRMSFVEHLEELRSRLIRILIGGGVAFVATLAFAIPIWSFVQAPLREAVDQYGGDVVALSPMEQFQIIWMWSPLVAAIFLAAPWVVYQVWAFVAPGLYPNERKWAIPFICITAGLFLTGGAFAYFIAFRFAMVFLLGIGAPTGVKPLISIQSYFSTFVNVILGVSILFEMPVAVFFLTLLRITTPGFLIRNSRYAILIIVILAAVVTPTPDPVNLTIFAVPMILLYFLGVFASYLLVLHREGQKFPWKIFFIWLAIVVVLVAAVIGFAVFQYGYQLVPSWPFLVR